MKYESKQVSEATLRLVQVWVNRAWTEDDTEASAKSANLARLVAESLAIDLELTPARRA